MRHYENKPHMLPMKRLDAYLMDLNNYLSLFPGSNDPKKMEEEELNKIMLHTV